MRGAVDSGRRLVSAFRDIRLFWKLLIPFFVLLLLLGVAGVVLIVRSLAVRADAELRADLSKRAVDVAVFIRDQEQSLLESVTVAANFVGLPQAIRSNSASDVDRFARTGLAVSAAARILVVTDEEGTALVELARGSGGTVRSSSGRSWMHAGPVREVLRGTERQRRSGLVSLDGSAYLVIVGPVSDPAVAGSVLVGMSADEIGRQASARIGASVVLYDAAGRRIGSGGSLRAGDSIRASSGSERRRTRVNGQTIETLLAPLEIAGRTAGTTAVAMSVKPFHSAVRGTGLRLAALLALAMLVVIAIGAGLSRFILAQVRPLVAVNRSLAEGNLSARAPVLARDELGELAAGFNDMATRLQASYEDLEQRVEERTTQLRSANEQLEKTAEAQAEFFAAMAHEFRAPLFAIIGHADMMQDPEYAPRGVRRVSQFGSTIKGAGDHVLRLVNEILEIAKLEAGHMRLTIEPVSVQSVIEEVLTEMKPLALKGNLRLVEATVGGLPAAAADRTAVKEIMLNLVSNAIKFTPKGGSVTVSARRSGNHVDVAVEDTGIGIPSIARPRIFEPFFQVDDERATHGQASSGLGLALTRRLVEALGGNIRLAGSRKGAKFIFSLPLAHDDLPVAGDQRSGRRENLEQRARTSLIHDG